MKVSKIKYWTATASSVDGMVVLTSEGQPFTNLKEAKKAKLEISSSDAVVVRAGKDENPTTEIVG